MPYLDLMISMDSANGHMAANTGIRVLTLWGMTHPFCGFSPFNQPLDHAITLDRTNPPYPYFGLWKRYSPQLSGCI